ncbi:group II intron reverse transcriptase/maturase [Bacillus sp. DTU_2020_1000418_1_SI_GHA_SEK_038]|uniref:group II intron reverse transcriptase/maturase n=1 Tax=Bacillus sp. DTU_2020_1000418_1_SI_GHA_SEK_038 TaxID=3077585 RepID=UPI0028F0E0EE|nr:group II intron reverse transcriptase/maturase [Bacillus sp. DTU_2020_1000418_1_SI_GHA_SEK_038]WNS76859.1 group II intron reverse transcriptase/maturase [Bacillus sp. DTU_2020_1000418_1_SI_GHA_SEK_038]WNS77049.1 group II intron reverse transcriptase/maturase [Bacillus sp. DTU_2020_1000418_1_SI_GHA_SEK_038]
MHRPQNTSKDGYSQMDRLETEEYAKACSSVYTEVGRQDGIDLIDKIIDDENLLRACEKVKANKGAPGIDGMKVDELFGHVQKYHKYLKRKLKDGTYNPLPVKRVEIPKPDGSKRKLGIPCVRDRMVQQAIYQVIGGIIDPYFSEMSYGFRPNRNQHQAIEQSIKYYEQGYKVVVDCDLKSYFDTINHQKLMEYLKIFIQDNIVLKLIWKFLKSGILENGLTKSTDSGAPQGGVLSPILSNIYLNQLDKELEGRGHKFVRFADDFCIYVKSKRAGQRVMESITNFLEKDLKLTVNSTKSQIGSPTKLKFLGFCIHTTSKGVSCRPHQVAKKRFKTKLKNLTKRNRPGKFEEIAKEINQATVGWINYYGISLMKRFIEDVTKWLNHRLRQIIWKRWKRVKTRYQQLRRLGIKHDEACKVANTRKGYWRISGCGTLHNAIKIKTLIKWGLKDLNHLYERRYSSY